MPVDSQTLARIYREHPRLQTAETLPALVAALNERTETIRLPAVAGFQVVEQVAGEDFDRLTAPQVRLLDILCRYPAISTDAPLLQTVLSFFPAGTTTRANIEQRVLTRTGSLVEAAFGPGHGATETNAAELAPHLVIRPSGGNPVQ